MASTMQDLKLTQLAINGAVTIAQVPQEEWDCVSFPVIIMGPTGAGKSSFVEALAGPNSSVKNLSSAGLEGYTQNVSVYYVEGVKDIKYDSDIYLMDTPGFADDKISLGEIVSMVQESVGKCERGTRVCHILYVMPITNTRLSGSQRKVLKAFKAITGREASAGVTIVTTMWDTIHGEQAQMRAQRNFEQLKSDIWKDFTDNSAEIRNNNTEIAKFVNTQASAMEVLDLAHQRTRYSDFCITDKTSVDQELPDRIFAVEIYNDLIERIESLKMRKDNIISNLENLPVSEDAAVRVIIISDLEEVIKMLTKFERQLEDFGIPPPTKMEDQFADSNLLAHIIQTPSDSLPFLPLSTLPTVLDQTLRGSQNQSRKKGLMKRLKESSKHFVDKLARHEHIGH